MALLFEIFANVVGGVGVDGLVVFVGGGVGLVCLWDRLRADSVEFFAPVASTIGSVGLPFALAVKSTSAKKEEPKTKNQNKAKQKKENQSQAKQSQKTKRKRRKTRRAHIFQPVKLCVSNAKTY